MSCTISPDQVRLQKYDNKEDLPRLEGSHINNLSPVYNFIESLLMTSSLHLHVLFAFDFLSYVAFTFTLSEWMHPTITVDYSFISLELPSLLLRLLDIMGTWFVYLASALFIYPCIRVCSYRYL